MERIKTGYGRDTNGNPLYLINHTRYVVNDDGETLEELLKAMAHVSDIEYINQERLFPSVGDDTRLYIDTDHEKLYYWSSITNSYNRINVVDDELTSSSHIHDNMEILNKIKHALTDELKNDFDSAYTHAMSEHAPVNAQKNTQSDWNSENDKNDDFILNRPKLGTIAAHNINEFATDIQGQRADSAIQSVYIDELEMAKNNGQVILPAYPTRESLSINNINDTADLDKPISTAAQLEFSNLDGKKQNNITGAASSILHNNLEPSKVTTTDENGKISTSTISVDELGYMENVTGNVQEQLDLKAEKVDLSVHMSDMSNPHKVTAAQLKLENVTNESKQTMFTSPAFSGIPTAPTPDTNTNTEQIATTKFVNTAVSNGIAASDAMIFKGTVGVGGTFLVLPTTYRIGWTYRVNAPGTYVDEVCEVGDLITALINRSGAGNLNSDWTVTQTNINGSVVNTRKIIAGQGLTGGGDLSADRTFNVGAGKGITVNADNIEVKANTIGTSAAIGKTIVNDSGIGVVLGEDSTSAFRGDHGKSSYDHSLSLHARVDSTKVEKSDNNGNIKVNGTETTVYTHPSGTNPHGATKSDVGLGNVANVSTNNQTPTFTVASVLSNIVSGETLSISMGKLMKLYADFIIFKEHKHTKSQITDMPTKLSQFTNDSNYITASDVDTSQNHTHTNKTILDKITQTLLDNWSNAFSHVSNKSNPHGVTTAQIGAAVSSHSHTELSPTVNSSNTSNTSTNKYCKLGTMKITSRYGFLSKTYEVIIGCHGSANNDYLRLNVWFKQQDEFGKSPYVYLSVFANDESIERVKFFAVVDELNAAYSQVSLYVQIFSGYTNCSLFTMSSSASNGTISYTNSSPFIDTLPTTGTKTTQTDYTNHHIHTKSQITDFPTSMPANGGNAATASKLSTERTITFTGDITGIVSFDGSQNVSSALSYAKLPSVDKILSGIIVSPSNFINLVAKVNHAFFTANSVSDVYFSEASIPIAQKANITVNTGNGYLELRAKKLPTGNLTLETIRIFDKSVTNKINGSKLLNGSINLEGYSNEPVIQSIE